MAFGFLNIEKPLHLTSHDVVARVRRIAGQKQVGHAGTLDPLATGVLVICVGAATRLSEYVMDSTKQYRAHIHLGITTDTYDAEGRVLLERDAGHLTRAAVEQALSAFLGDIRQVPPMYSAIKQGGKKLYELARQGETVERVARAVRIDALNLTQWQPTMVTLEVTCSAGTYIRSLAYDLGEVLGVGAHLAGLTRTASGKFTLEQAVPLDILQASDDWKRYLISPETALTDMPAVRLDEAASEDVLHGRSVTAQEAADGTLARAYNASGDFIAIVRFHNQRWLPHKVFNSS